MKVSYDLNFEKFLDLWSKAEKSKDKKAQYKLGSLYFKSKHPDAAANLLCLEPYGMGLGKLLSEMIFRKKSKLNTVS